MSFGQRLRDRRKELGISQGELAKALGISVSAVSNYETGLNAMREDVLLRLFHVLQVEPNYLYQDDFESRQLTLSAEEERLVRRYRALRVPGRQALRAVADSLAACQEELEAETPEQDLRQIPLYRSPAAAGYAAPVFGEDFDYIDVTGQVPQGAEFAVRIQGDSMEPFILDGSTVYVNRDPLSNGDVGVLSTSSPSTVSAPTPTWFSPAAVAGPWSASGGSSCRSGWGCRAGPANSLFPERKRLQKNVYWHCGGFI